MKKANQWQAVPVTEGREVKTGGLGGLGLGGGTRPGYWLGVGGWSIEAATGSVAEQITRLHPKPQTGQLVGRGTVWGRPAGREAHPPLYLFGRGWEAGPGDGNEKSKAEGAAGGGVCRGVRRVL